MGRFTAYDQNGRMVADFDKSDYDFLCRYGRTPEEALSENAKLRELVAGIGHLLFSLDVDYCATCPRDGINHPCHMYTVEGGECLYKTDMRELGIEVDE